MSKLFKIIMLAAITSIAIVALFKGTSAAGGRGWLSDYAYSRAIVVNNTSISALTDYLVRIENPIYNETGLLGSWHFEEGAGITAADTSGNGKNGTLSSGVSRTTSGKSGKGLSFNGWDSYVDCGNIGAVNSVEFYIDDSNYSDGVLELNSSAGISISAGKITASGFISPEIYVNAVKDAALAKGFNHIVVTTATAISASAVKIGLANSDYTNGVIDEVRFYNRVLTSEEVTERSKAKAKLNYGDIRFTDSDGTGLIKYWIEKDGTFWIKAPLVPKDLNKVIYVYYGNDKSESVSDAGMAAEVSARKPAEPEPTVNIYAEQENLQGK